MKPKPKSLEEKRRAMIAKFKLGAGKMPAGFDIVKTIAGPVLGSVVLDAIEAGKSIRFIAPCEHKNIEHLGDDISWCVDCGAHRVGETWVEPKERTP